jgi:hypothetical protein
MGREGRGRAATVLVFLAIATAYVVLIPGVWYIRQDSATCLGVARSLAEGRGYAFNGGPYAKYPPVFPLLLSIVYRARGFAPWGFQLVVALSGVGAVGAAWLLVRGRAGRGPAMAVAVLSATSVWFLSYSTIWTMSAVCYAFFSLLTIWVAERAVAAPGWTLLRWTGVAVLAIVAIYTHLFGVALIPALAGGILLAQERPRRERLLATGVVVGLCSLAALLWLWRGLGVEPGGMSYNALIATSPVHVIEDPLGRLALRLTAWVATPLSLERQMVPWPAAVVLFLVLCMPGLVRGLRKHRGAADLYVCSFAVLLVVMAGKYSQERYIVFLLPLLFYYGYLSLCVWAERAPRVRTAMMAGAFLAVLGSAGYRLARGKAEEFTPAVRAAARQRLDDWREAGRWAAQHVPEDATVFGYWAIVHFFTRRHAVNYRRGCPVEGQFERMLETNTGFVLHAVASDFRPRVGLASVLERHPDTFRLLEQNGSCALYAVRRELLPDLIRALRGAQ